MARGTKKCGWCGHDREDHDWEAQHPTDMKAVACPWCPGGWCREPAKAKAGKVRAA